MMPDWTLLPEELLHLISKNLDNCFDVVHARSVCRTWRSAFPFPSSLLRPRYFLPTFVKFPLVSKNLCYIEKIHLFLFRVQAPAADVSSIVSSPSENFFLGGIRKDMSKNHKELPCHLQCSVKGDYPRFHHNVLDCHILPLGYHYRMICWNLNHTDWEKHYGGLAFLPLNKEGDGEGEFVVLLIYKKQLLVLRSAEMKWMQVKRISNASCKEIVTFRGRFYAIFTNGDVFVINPYSLEATPLITLMPIMYQYPWMPLMMMPPGSQNYLVPSGNDELFLVKKFDPVRASDDNRFTCRVSTLAEEAGIWVEVSELGDRVLFIGRSGNFCFSAKEFPNYCVVTGNSILFSNEPGNETSAYKYGVYTGRAEDHLNLCRSSRENRVFILKDNTSPVAVLLVECQSESLALDT